MVTVTESHLFGIYEVSVLVGIGFGFGAGRGVVPGGGGRSMFGELVYSQQCMLTIKKTGPQRLP